MQYLIIRDLEEMENNVGRHVFREREDAFELSDNNFVKLFRLNKRCAAHLIADLEEVMELATRESAIPVSLKARHISVIVW